MNRLTVGVLIGFHLYEGSQPASFAFPLIRGMQAAAKEKNVNLMVGCGVALRVGSNLFRPAWPDVNPGMDFVPVGPWNTDGLLIIVPLLTQEKIQYTRQLVSEGFPVLFVGGDSGTPAVLVDNEGGVRKAMEHLVQHGHRSVAFIAGDDQDTGDSLARVTAYRKGLREFGLNDDPQLVGYGYHWNIGGYRAMQRLIQSGVKFTAVMCSNDLSALGATRALQEAGFRVPRDVAVTGFDDVLEGVAQVPPLTSVHYPLFEAGYRALLLLQKRIEQGPAALPDITRISTWLVPRQSCGCLPDIVTKSAVSNGASVRGADWILPQDKEGLARVMLDALRIENSRLPEADALHSCGLLADGFLQSVDDGNIVHFQSALTDVLQRVELISEEDANLWHSVVTVLREAVYAMPMFNNQPARIQRAEDLLHQARTMLSESVGRRYTRQQVNQNSLDETIGLLNTRLISSVDEDQVYSALREDLPRLGVQSCNVVFFEPQGEDPMAMSLLHPLEPGAPILRFETRHFPPPGLYPEGEPFNLALLPLNFQEERMGYVAFDGVNLDPLATLVRQVASSINNVHLHAKVLELSLTDALTGVYNRRNFEILLQKEVDRSRRYNRDLAVIMADIDHFKLYNDAFGHPAGDRALQEIARCITHGARRGVDVVTRYGGEEFAIILPETDPDGAKIVAEKIRSEIAGSSNFLQQTTISLGIGSLRGDRLKAQKLVDQADRALYQAKQQGRNRVVVFEEWMIEAAHGQAAGGPQPVTAADRE
jgi:diguanylate cyclase (GGDEF)-like protein